MTTRNPDERALISVPAGARMLGVHPNVLRGAVLRGEVRGVTLNGRTWVKRVDLDALLAPVAPAATQIGAAAGTFRGGAV